jgi:hypothetical protein
MMTWAAFHEETNCITFWQRGQSGAAETVGAVV